MPRSSSSPEMADPKRTGRGTPAQRSGALALALAAWLFLGTASTFGQAPPGYAGGFAPLPPTPPGSARAPISAVSGSIPPAYAPGFDFQPPRLATPAQAIQPAPPMPLPAPSPVQPGLTPPGTGVVPFNPYGGALSNPLLSPLPPTLGMTPIPTPATREKLNKHIQRLIDPEATLDLVVGQARVLILKSAPFRVQAGDERTLALTMVNPRELLLQGKTVGSTVLNIWFGDKDDPTKQEVLTYLLRVYPDPEALARTIAAFQKLQDDINAYFKDTSIKIRIVGDKVVVSGRVRDYIQGQQVLQMVRAGTGGSGGVTGTGGGGGGGGTTQPGGTAGQVPLTPAASATDLPIQGDQPPPGLDQFQAMGGPNVINLLEVAGEQQVLLRVVVAEVNRAAARSIGMNFSVTNNHGITVFSNNTGPVSPFSSAGASSSATTGGTSSGAGFGGTSSGGVIGNLSAIFDAGKIPFAINAMRTMQYAKALAEPTLVTTNGQPASFLAGGQFPVPITTGLTLGGLQGVQYVPYGVMLYFTPYITDRDRIRLQLRAIVSDRDLNTATNIGGGSVAGLTSRMIYTTVELRQGETLAVAGLIETNSGANSTRIPFLGALPMVGQLTGVTQHQAGEKELVIFVTPELTRPIDPEVGLKLPGYEILDPNDLEFYFWGRIEGHCKDYRSPIRTDLGRIKQYQRIEQAHVAGPSGYTPPSP